MIIELILIFFAADEPPHERPAVFCRDHVERVLDRAGGHATYYAGDTLDQLDGGCRAIRYRDHAGETALSWCERKRFEDAAISLGALAPNDADGVVEFACRPAAARR